MIIFRLINLNNLQLFILTYIYIVARTNDDYSVEGFFNVGQINVGLFYSAVNNNAVEKTKKIQTERY